MNTFFWMAAVSAAYAFGMWYTAYTLSRRFKVNGRRTGAKVTIPVWPFLVPFVFVALGVLTPAGIIG